LIIRNNREPNAQQGKPLITRGGLKVKEFHCFNKETINYPIFILTEKDSIYQLTIRGKRYDNLESEADLFMDEEKTVEYTNVYIPSGEYYITARGRIPHKSKEDCIKDQFANELAVLEITKIDGKITNVQSVHIY
jgi:hypothetical protein